LGVGHTYAALVANDRHALPARLFSPTSMVQAIDGTVLSSSAERWLGGGRLFALPLPDAGGGTLSPSERFYTGARNDAGDAGSSGLPPASTETCSNWSDELGEAVLGSGEQGLLHTGLTSAQRMCNVARHVLCVRDPAEGGVSGPIPAIIVYPTTKRTSGDNDWQATCLTEGAQGLGNFGSNFTALTGGTTVTSGADAGLNRVLPGGRVIRDYGGRVLATDKTRWLGRGSLFYQDLPNPSNPSFPLSASESFWAGWVSDKAEQVSTPIPCQGWSSAAVGQLGRVGKGSGGFFVGTQSCDVQLPTLCFAIAAPTLDRTHDLFRSVSQFIPQQYFDDFPERCVCAMALDNLFSCSLLISFYLPFTLASLPASQSVVHCRAFCLQICLANASGAGGGARGAIFHLP